MAIRLRPSSTRAGVVVSVLLLVLLFSSSTVTAAATPEERYHRYQQHRSRRFLVTAPRVSLETTPTGALQEQEMDVAGWRAATPFLGARASLGRRIPGSHANPSHN